MGELLRSLHFPFFSLQELGKDYFRHRFASNFILCGLIACMLCSFVAVWWSHFNLLLVVCIGMLIKGLSLYMLVNGSFHLPIHLNNIYDIFFLFTVPFLLGYSPLIFGLILLMIMTNHFFFKDQATLLIYIVFYALVSIAFFIVVDANQIMPHADLLSGTFISISVYGILGWAVIALFRNYRAESQYSQAEARQHGEKKYIHLFEHSRIGMVKVDLSGKFIEVNKAFCKMLGYTKAEFLQLSFVDITHKNSLKETLEIKEKLALDSSSEYLTEKLYCRKDGQIVHALTSINSLKNDKNEAIGAIAIIHDITDRKTQHEAFEVFNKATRLAPGESYFRILVKSIVDSFSVPYVMICEIIPNTQIVEAKAFWAKDRFVDTRFDLDGTPCEKVYEQETDLNFEKNLYNLFPKDLYLKKKSLTNYLGFPLFNSHNQIIGHLALFGTENMSVQRVPRDLMRIYCDRIAAEMERSTIEKNLKEREAQLSLINETLRQQTMLLVEGEKASGTASWIYHLAKKEVYHTPSMAKILDMQDEGIEGMELWIKSLDKVLEEDKQTIIVRIQEQIQSRSVWSGEYRIRTRNGSIKWIRSKAIRWIDDQTLLGMCQDITEEKQALEEIEKWTYSVSHNLRTPISHIQGFGEHLSENVGNELPEQLQVDMEGILRGVDQMNDMISGLMDFAQSRNVILKWQTIDLQEIVQQKVRDFQKNKKHQDIHWVVEKLPKIEADEALIKQAFDNLLTNAIKFTAKEALPFIRIWSENTATHTTIFVQDNGVGFGENESPKLFDLFRRLPEHQNFEGNGIGLAHVAEIIRRHGGQIQAKGKSGKGAIFFFTLPLQKAKFD